MSNSDQVRWQQRFDNFSKALSKLSSACQQDEYTELERAGLIQMFEFAFELAWKTLKDLLFYEGFDVGTPRETIRKSYVAGYLNEEDTETFLEALNKRNLLSHTYREEVAEEAVNLIKQHYHPLLKHLHSNLMDKRT